MEKVKYFVESNSIKVELSDDSYIFKNPWGENCLEIVVPRESNLTLLESITLPKRLIALNDRHHYLKFTDELNALYAGS